jgi:hypothetical protein
MVRRRCGAFVWAIGLVGERYRWDRMIPGRERGFLSTAFPGRNLFAANPLCKVEGILMTTTVSGQAKTPRPREQLLTDLERAQALHLADRDHLRIIQTEREFPSAQ